MKKRVVSRKTTAVHKELEHESARLAGCLCAAIDAISQAYAYAERRHDASGLQFSGDNVTSLALSMYIRKRDEAKPQERWNRREVKAPDVQAA